MVRDKRMDMDKELDQFMATMDKKFGERSLIEFDDGVAAVEALATGILSLDYELGVGGMPRGRVIEIFGGEGVGKTTVAIKVAAECQKRRGQLPVMLVNPNKDARRLTGRVGFLDVEHAFNPEYAKIHGLDLSKGSGFVFDQPMSGTEAMNKLEYMVDSNLFDVIIVDSVAGLVTDAEQSKDIGEVVMAGTAQLMSQSLKKLVSKVNKSRTLVVFINQIREKPAVQFGSPETTTGGRALKFYASLRMRVSRGESILKSSKRIGHKMKIAVQKNKVAAPYKDTIIDLIYEEGFDDFSDVLQVSTKLGVVELRGSSYQYVSTETGEIYKAQGKVKWFELLESNENLFNEIKEATLKTLVGGNNDDGQKEDKQKQ